MDLSSINEIWEIIKEIEGGYVNNPLDHGGETKYGISAATYPDIDIKNLTPEDALQIFYKDYFIPLRCDWWLSIGRKDIALLISCFAFNTGNKNSGHKPTIKILQRLINTINGKDILIVDGKLGPKTMEKIELLKEPLLTKTNFKERLGNFMRAYYINLTQFSVFGREWMIRMNTCLEAFQPIMTI